MSDEPSVPVRGPLDQLFPGLRAKTERVAAMAVHPRVVRAVEDDGGFALVLVSFRRAASLRAYHAALKPLIEAALLHELCRPLNELVEDKTFARTLELYAYERPAFDARPALATFALAERSLDEQSAQKALSLVRHEATQVDNVPAAEPEARYVADLAYAPHPLARSLEAYLRAHGPQVAWGREPGVLARLAADYLAAHGVAGVAPTREGIEILESVCVHGTPFALRWIPPASFQALCDLVAVHAASADDLTVEWGVCEPDEASALTPPPVLRIHRGDDAWHVPLGEHVLRWCIMPAQPNEPIPSLGAWAEHEFA